MGEHKSRYVLVACVVSFLAAAAFLGCEKTNRAMGLTVTPNASILSQAGQRVTLTAALPQVNASVVSNRTEELLYPLEWSVTDETQGRIVSAAGDSAVYRCDVGHGGNTVIVRDQANREGLAGIN